MPILMQVNVGLDAQREGSGPCLTPGNADPPAVCSAHLPNTPKIFTEAFKVAVKFFQQQLLTHIKAGALPGRHVGHTSAKADWTSASN
jgi:hypothetical protein